MYTYINKDTIRIYFQKLRERGESDLIINRKLSSVDKFVEWAHQKGTIDTIVFKQIKETIADFITSTQSGYKAKESGKKTYEEAVQTVSPIPQTISFPSRLAQQVDFFTFGILKRIPLLNLKLKTQKSNLQLKDQSLKENKKPLNSPFSILNSEFGMQHYIGFAIVLIFMALLGAGIYNQFFQKNQSSFAYPSTLTKAGRILSFQGRLTDSVGNPITTATNVHFDLYNVSSGGSPIYSTGTCSTTPDQDGVFSALIGGSGYSPTPPQSVCGTEIPSSIFSENANIYMGVTVAGDFEMSPRQQIANVGYAINSETLQGFPPGNGINNIPFINQSGDLLIATASPGIRSTYASGSFTLSSANTTVIQSAGTGDVILQATESGVLRFRTGGTTDSYTRIYVDNSGNVGIGTTTPTQALTVTGNATASGNITLGGQLQLGRFPVAPTAIGSGSLYYDTTANTVYVYNGSAWTGIGSGGGTSYWTLAPLGGAITPTNTTLDVLLGGTATSSAKFAFVNMNAGIPTATISGNLALQVPTGTTPANQLNIFNGGSLNLQTSLGGDTGLASRLFVANNGNVGVGTTNPLAQLHVMGQCVVADTELKRKRKRKKRGANGEWIEEEYWEDVRIDEIEEGDEIMSMDVDGSFVTRKVAGLKNMGYQPIYKLITHTGKQIRTTANHPYFVLEKRPINELKNLYATFEVDQSNRLEDMGKDSVVSIFSVDQSYPVGTTIKISKRTKLAVKRKFYATRPKYFGPEMLAILVIYAIWDLGLKVGKLVIDKEYTKYEKTISQFFYRYYPETSIWFKSIGHNSLAHQAAWSALKRQKALRKSALVESGANLVFKESLATELLFPGIPTGDSQSTRLLLPILYQSPLSLSRGEIADAEWTPAKYLKKGMLVATIDGWETISTIFETGAKEETYDVEIIGTHNFVGNGIVAHNTYLQGGDQLNTSYSLRTSDSLGNVGMVVTNAGNVGIGTTSPLATLDIAGSASASGNLTFRGSGTAHNINLYDNGSLQIANSVGGGTATPAFVVTSAGNIGIGNTAPGQKLDVTGNLQFSQALMPNSTAGSTGQFLISQGANTAPTWTSTVPATSVPFSGITTGINTSATMTVGTGATLTYSGSGVINATQLLGNTWIAPGTIGSTTPNTGAFTTLSANSTGNALTLSGAGANIAFSGAGLAQITTAASQNLALMPGGNVGIGTTGPGSNLTVQTSSTNPNLILYRTTGGAGSGPNYINTDYYAPNGSSADTLATSIYAGNSGGGAGATLSGYGLKFQTTSVFDLSESTAGTRNLTLTINPATTGYLTTVLKGGSAQTVTNPLLALQDSTTASVVTGDVKGNVYLSGNLNTSFGGMGNYANLLTYSEQFDNAAWTKNSVTVSADSTTAPNGTTTADNISINSGGCAGGSIVQSTQTAAGSNTFTGSVYVRKAAGTTFTLTLAIDNDSGANQSATTSKSLSSSSTTWQRLQVSKTFSSATGNVRMTLSGGGCGYFPFDGWGAQIEQNSSAGPYAYAGANTVVASTGLVLNNTLRFSNVTTSITTGTNENFTIVPGGTGNVGIGTTSPLAKLHVEGSCVTGDTLLPIRRKKKRRKSKTKITGPGHDPDPTKKSAEADLVDLASSSNGWLDNLTGSLIQIKRFVKSKFVGVDSPGIEPGRLGLSSQPSEPAEPAPSFSIAETDWEYEYLYERIDSVLPGDEVLSLNEDTGRVEWHTIKNRMDMGVRDIYEITTKSGRKIRTTGNHPYLVQLLEKGANYV